MRNLRSARGKPTQKGNVILLVSLVVVGFFVLIANPVSGLTPRPSEPGHLTPAQYKALYESEVAYNVTGPTSTTLTVHPGENASGSFAIQVFKPSVISTYYLGTKSFSSNTNLTSLPAGTVIYLNVPGVTQRPQNLVSAVVIDGVAGESLRFDFTVIVPTNAPPGTYSFQFVLFPQGSSYLARFFDVNLIVE